MLKMISSPGEYNEKKKKRATEGLQSLESPSIGYCMEMDVKFFFHSENLIVYCFFEGHSLKKQGQKILPIGQISFEKLANLADKNSG